MPCSINPGNKGKIAPSFKKLTKPVKKALKTVISSLKFRFDTDTGVKLFGDRQFAQFCFFQQNCEKSDEKKADPDSEQILGVLTPREREIAADLDITERTVKAHLTSIYEKTKTGNRLNLALLINQWGGETTEQ